jgi:hypothetical protein
MLLRNKRAQVVTGAALWMIKLFLIRHQLAVTNQNSQSSLLGRHLRGL